MACLQKTRTNSIVWPRDIADDPAPLSFEAIETIIWKLPIAPVVRIVSKYFETTGAIGTIRTITWKRGLRLWLKLMPNIKARKLATKLFDALHCYAVMVKYTPLKRSSLSSLNCQPLVFFPFTHHQNSYGHGLWYHYYIMHIFPLYHCMHQKKDGFTHSCVLFLLFSFHNIITNYFSA